MKTARLNRNVRTAVQCCCVVGMAISLSCSKKSGQVQVTGGPTSSASVGLAAGAPLAHRQLACRSLGSSFSLGPIESERAAEADDDPDGDGAGGDLPFGVSVGEAQVRDDGFVISAIDARSDGNHAVLAFVDSAVSRGRVLDLGRVYGDTEPPKAILRARSAFVVVPDNNASGGIYRYGWLTDLDSSGRMQWLGTIDEHVDDSAVFSIASVDSTIAVAWDEVDRKTRRSHVRWGTLSESRRSNADQQRQSSLQKTNDSGMVVRTTSLDSDAEGPQLVAHRSGYWLAYLASDGARGRRTDEVRGRLPAKSQGGRSAIEDEVRAVELGRRGIVLVPLDVEGRAIGEPMPITERTAPVLTFEIAASSDGGAIVAYRESETSPGAEERTIELVRVRADGGLVRQRLDDERVGVGMPELLVDLSGGRASNPPGSPWLAVASSTGETGIAELVEQGASPVLELFDAPGLGGAEPLLRRGDSLLVARHRARFVEFERVDCKWSGTRKTPARSALP